MSQSPVSKMVTLLGVGSNGTRRPLLRIPSLARTVKDLSSSIRPSSMMGISIVVSVSPGSKVIRPDWASKSEGERAAPLRVAYSAVIAQTLGMSSLKVIKAVPADSEAVVLSTLIVGSS